MTLAFVKTAFVGRLTRTSLLEVLGKDYIRTARAKGAPREPRHLPPRAAERAAAAHHRDGAQHPRDALRARSRSSSSSTGRASAAADQRHRERDYPVIQGGIVVFALFVVVINLVIDLLYIVVDPRMRMKCMTSDRTSRCHDPPEPAPMPPPGRADASAASRPGRNRRAGPFVLVAVLRPGSRPTIRSPSDARINRRRAGSIGSAPTSSAATCCRVSSSDPATP